MLCLCDCAEQACLVVCLCLCACVIVCWLLVCLCASIH